MRCTEKFIVGSCSRMCPTAEINMRKSKNLIHFYEKKTGVFVKEFSRSAADKKMEKPENIRSFEALTKTLEYLFTTILQDSEKPLNFRYDFIFDRCRAVRQEIVMQNFNCAKTISLLEPIIMFLSYSLYRMNGLPISAFDAKICTQHLQECLHKCIACYEESDVGCEKGEYRRQNRIIVESIYLMLNIGELSSLQHALKLDSGLKSTFALKTALQIAISFHQRNFHRLLHLVVDLPHLVGAIASLSLSIIRKEVFRVFSIAYSSQSLRVPLEFLKRLLIYDEKSTLMGHLRGLGICNDNDLEHEISAINFNRKKFDETKKISNTSQHFVDQKLQDFHLPDLILARNI